MIMLNQVGYHVAQRKVAVVQEPGSYQVKDCAGKTFFEAETSEGIWESLCDETLYTLDFSQVEEPGVYCLEKEGGSEKCKFLIGNDVYRDVHNAMCKAFYFQRCGCALEEKYAGRFAHEACHTNKVSLWEDRTVEFECLGGWHDAGDYGRYINTAAVTVAHLLYAYVKYPRTFLDELSIPETGNGTVDILNECRYELEWMLKMQAHDGGVFHKLTSQMHAGCYMPQEDHAPFYAFSISSTATGDFCACMALAARVYKDVDIDFSQKMKEAAQKAWTWLEEHPEPVFFHNPQDSNTGEYGDISDKDERLWAAVEMFYLMAGEGESTSAYLEYIEDEVDKISLVHFGWSDVAGFVTLAVLGDKQDLVGEGIYNTCRQAIMKEADRLLDLSKHNIFAIGMESQDYIWGSNMIIANRGIVWTLAYELTGNEAYKDAVCAHIDYLLGKNITGYSFVTGYGENAYRHPHSLPMEADGVEEPIPGWVSGGPNADHCDYVSLEVLKPGTAPMKCYVDRMGSYSTNEMCICWNSPVIYITAFLRRELEGNKL